MLYHQNNYWKCLRKKSLFPSKNKSLFFRIIQQMKRNCFKSSICIEDWRGIPHKTFLCWNKHFIYNIFYREKMTYGNYQCCVHSNCKSSQAFLQEKKHNIVTGCSTVSDERRQWRWPQGPLRILNKNQTTGSQLTHCLTMEWDLLIIGPCFLSYNWKKLAFSLEKNYYLGI